MWAGGAFRFDLQKTIMTGSAIQNNTRTINGGSRGLEVCLSIPAEPFKNFQPTSFSFFFFHFSDQRYLLYASTIEKLAPRKL